MRIGLIAGSYSPYHAGHDGLVRLASSECDEVHLFVSLSDRARPGEIAVLGTDKAKIWQTIIEPSLPDNVEVTYGGSPIGNIWKELGNANIAGSEDTFILYGDVDDAATNFSKDFLTKYAGDLYRRGLIEVRPVKRTDTVDVSGTRMRQYLAAGDAKSFIAGLPRSIDGQRVWDILSATAASKPTVKTTARAKKPTKR